VILIAAAFASAVVTPGVPGTGQFLRVLFVALVFIACAAGVRVFAASTSSIVDRGFSGQNADFAACARLIRSLKMCALALSWSLKLQFSHRSLEAAGLLQQGIIKPFLSS
jgi:hypothetical protein